jgi:hypothetical protein
MSPTSIFLDFSLPNATTWFYFSLLLAVALFFRFSRLWSMRNWDVVTLFLLVPGLLILQQVHASLVPSEKGLWTGYLWLFCGSVYLLARCLFDLTLVRRPALSPNLNFGGLAWLGTALAVCLVAVALRQPPGTAVAEPVGKVPAAVAKAQEIEGRVGPQLLNGHPWVIPTLALFCHLAIVIGLFCVGYRHFQDPRAGMAAAVFYLLLPYTAIHIGQVHHVWPTALIVWAVVAYRLPMLTGFLLGMAAGSAYFPALVFPVWLSFYRRRGAGRFAAAFVLTAGATLAVTGTLLWLQGDLVSSLRDVLQLSDWQPWKTWKQPHTEGFWRWIDGTSIHWAYRLPVFVLYVAFLITTAFWPSPKNLAHVLALTAALLIGAQLWYADQGGVYVLWYLPLLNLLVFRPNLSDRVPPPIAPDADWLTRLGRLLARWWIQVLRLPEPVAKV